MKGTSIGLAAWFVLASFAGAQQPSLRPAPNLPANIVGSELVVWSEMQKPHPTPQPLPPPERADQPQSAQPQAEGQAPSLQAYAGTIVKDESKYVLRVSEGLSYNIDDQEKAGRYEGKRVKINGTLDAQTKLLHVASIELLS